MKSRYRGAVVVRASCVLSAAALAAQCRAQFVAGEVYLVSPALPDPGGPCFAPGILRISPGTWQTSVLTRLPTGLVGRGAYDPFRARLVVTWASYVELVDSAGTRTALSSPGYYTAQFAAPTGDGRIYLWGNNAALPVHYYDAANAVQTLMDATGSTPFLLSANIGALTYDAGTNCLFAAALIGGDLTQIIKVPLNVAGTQVQGSISTVSFDASAGSAGEYPMGFSRGPGGSLFLKIDDNTGNTAGRMRLIDPVTLNVQVFASSGYFGVGGECAGVYVPAVGMAVVLDSLNDKLRGYVQGESGAGTILPSTGVSSCGSGEAAQLLLIDFGACHADFNGDGFLDPLDYNQFINAFESGDPSADYNYDGFIDPLDYNAFINDFEAGC